LIPLWVDLEPQWRGGQNQALLALRGLRARGHPAELVALGDCALARRAQAEGIPVHGVGRRGARWQAAWLLRRLLARETFDLLHANEAHALTAAWLARAHRRLPVVASRRVAYALQANPLALARYRSAGRIVAISQFVAKTLAASGIPAERVEVIHDGVEVPPLPSPELRRRARQSWGVGEGEALIGCVGYLLPDKGQDTLIRALGVLRAQSGSPGRTCHLLLAGDGPCRRSLEHLARELRVESAVHFAGLVEHVSQIHAALDVFVFPSLLDALGTALLAAMAYGLPVVALERGGVPEIIEDGQNGLLIPARDPAAYPEAIAAAVARLLGEAALATRLGAAARETVQQRFAADQMVEQTLRVYRKVVSSAGAD
jgi:glycosyltransferase involved in cell wall biosynthesis